MKDLNLNEKRFKASPQSPATYQKSDVRNVVFQECQLIGKDQKSKLSPVTAEQLKLNRSLSTEPSVLSAPNENNRLVTERSDEGNESFHDE